MKWWIDASYFKDDHVREMSSKILESVYYIYCKNTNLLDKMYVSKFCIYLYWDSHPLYPLPTSKLEVHLVPLN